MNDYRKILFPYAYNILGSSEDARDAIQDVLSNFISSSREGIENVKGYLIKGVINRSINIKRKNKKMGTGDVWLPEPFSTEAADTDVNLRDIASYSMLILLELLNPKERAVFILKESFDYSHGEIADVLSTTEEHARKLLSRAKEKLHVLKTKKKGDRKQVPISFVEKYINAIRERDTKSLETILTQDITFYADGGPKLQVVKKSCVGVKEVVDLLIFVHHKFHTSLSIKYAQINHQPALLFYNEDKLIVCQIFGISVEQDKIQQINTVIDPEKLRYLTGVQSIELQKKYL